jgi:hypothetical protein
LARNLGFGDSKAQAVVVIAPDAALEHGLKGAGSKLKAEWRFGKGDEDDLEIGLE